MTKHLFVVNPGAGGEDRTHSLVSHIRGFMDRHGYDYQVETTTHSRHAHEIVSRYVLDGSEWQVYACGGDGTLNEVACAAAGLPYVAVTHFPCGMGNDFIRIFGPDASRFSDLSELVCGRVVQFDLVAVNEQYALNIASVGFDAMVANEMYRFRRIRNISSKRAYDLSVVFNLFRGLHRPYEVYIDGVRQSRERYTILLAANGRFYGGGYNPVPEAMPDDGALDFLMAGPVSRLKLMRMIGKFSKGRHHEMPELFTYARGKSMEIRCRKKEPVNIDGEIIMTDHVTFSLADCKINFIVPQGAQWDCQATTDEAFPADAALAQG